MHLIFTYRKGFDFKNLSFEYSMFENYWHAFYFVEVD